MLIDQRATYGLRFVQGALYQNGIEMQSNTLDRVTKRHIAALATWRVRRATAMITANPVENFTNSMKNGSERLFLFFRLFIGGDGIEEVLVGIEYRRILYTQFRDDALRSGGVAGKIGHFCKIV